MLILDAQKNFLTTYKNKGFLDQGDYDRMRIELDRNVINLDNYSFPEVEVSFNTFLVEYPIFRCLSNEDVFTLQQSASEQTFLKDQYVFTKSQKLKFIYMIMSGVVEEDLNGTEIQRGIGSILSYSHILNQNFEALSSAIVKSDSVTLKCLEIKSFAHFTKKNKAFEDKIIKNSVFTWVKIYQATSGILSKIDENTLNEVVSSAEVSKYENKETVKFLNGGYLIEGEIQKKQPQENQYEVKNNMQGGGGPNFQKLGEYSYIPPSQNDYEVQSKQIKVLIFKTNVNQKMSY